MKITKQEIKEIMPCISYLILLGLMLTLSAGFLQ